MYSGVWLGPKLTDKIDPKLFVERKLIEDDVCYKLRIQGGHQLSVLDRMTGFGYRDIETGYRDSKNRFWLASGGCDVRDQTSLTIAEAIQWVKDNANINKGET